MSPSPSRPSDEEPRCLEELKVIFVISHVRKIEYTYMSSSKHYLQSTTLLTIHVESDSFADCWWNSIVGETEVDAGIEAAHMA